MIGVVGVADEVTPGQGATYVVEGRGLVRVYAGDGGGRRALDGVDVLVARGSMMAIMGPSGSGKSTLLHLLGGLDTPTAGSVVLDGQDLSRLRDRDLTVLRRRSVGFVFQAFNLVPALSVEENVAYPLVLEGWRDRQATARVAEVLELVGLRDRRRDMANRLSGGEQQRVAIARAIVFDPAIVLADEPTGNLDSATGDQVMAALRNVQRRSGRTVVVATHDPRVAATADELVELRDGLVARQMDLRSRPRRLDHVVDWLGRDD